MRFLIPILPLLAAASARSAVVLLEAISLRVPTHRKLLATTVPVVLAGLLVLSTKVYLEQTPRLARDYAVHGAKLHEMVRHPVYRWIDENLPPDATLLLMGTNRGFFVPRMYVADSFFEASQIGAAFADAGDAASAAQRLREMGITHVLVDRGGVRVPYPRPLLELLRQGARAPSAWASPDRRFELIVVPAPESG
jgi:hypothetical protein